MLILENCILPSEADQNFVDFSGRALHESPLWTVSRSDGYLFNQYELLVFMELLVKVVWKKHAKNI